jgi:RHS repeat-associated protein
MDQYFLDALGSTRMLYNYESWATGQNDDIDYYPFGGERDYVYHSSNVDKFTGKERDSESGLDNFISPDWSDDPDAVPYADLGSPQSLNLYSYVENNPITNTDPDGHNCAQADDGTWFDDGAGGGCDKSGINPDGSFDQSKNQIVHVDDTLDDDERISVFLDYFDQYTSAQSLSEVAINANSWANPVETTLAQCATSSVTGSGCSKSGFAMAALFPIAISEARLTKVLEAHTKSLFSNQNEVKGLIEAAETVQPTKQAFGQNLQRIVDAGRIIGSDRATGAPTSIYTVITDKSGALVTAFPGRP